MKKIIFNFIYSILLLALVGCTFVQTNTQDFNDETPSVEENQDDGQRPFEPDIVDDESTEVPPLDETPTQTDPLEPDLDVDDIELPDEADTVDPNNPDETTIPGDSEDSHTTEDPLEETSEEIIIESHVVKFYVEDNVVFETSYDTFELIQKPIDPTKINHEFTGWYMLDHTLYDFNQPVLEDINLYAFFELDYALIINLLATEYMSTNVEISARHWNTSFLNREVDVIGGLGSGVIFSIQADTYYVLTNNHVVYDYGRSNHEYIIKDYKGNTYTAQLYTGSNQASYDLAILYFTKQDEDLKVSSFGQINPNVSDTVLSLGQPDGQDNTFTIGEVLSYRKITLSGDNIESSNVEFDVIRHNAPIAAGSSGGVILNTSFEIIGINYAGIKDGAFDLNAIGYAIPVEKVLEYLMYYFNEPIQS